MKKNRKTIVLALKVFIGLACFWLIAQRLYTSYSPENLNTLRDIFSYDNLLLLSIAFFLLFVNWGIEVKKWSIITHPVEKISFFNAWQSVWTGVCIGNLTPGRLGEFAGRILFFSAGNRARIATSHFVCGITQMLVTIIFGCTGLLFYSSGLNKGTYFVTMGLELALLVALSLILLRVNKVVAWLLQLIPFSRVLAALMAVASM